MTATNHVLTGVAIGFLVGAPLIAIPAAFLSHFVCDALPHFDDASTTPAGIAKWIGSKAFKRNLALDIILASLILLTLLITQPTNWFLAAVCGVLAASPDVLWLKAYFLARQKKPWHPTKLENFLIKIQWFARPIGLVVEGAWFIAGMTTLIIFVN